MKRGNKGYTLVELIVVLSILSIVAVAGFSIIGYLNGTKAKSAAYSIQSGLGKARIETMSRSRGKQAKDVYLSIKKDGNYYYMELYNTRQSATDPISKELIGNSSIEYIVAISPTGTKCLGNDGDLGTEDVTEIKFYFDRSTGGLTKPPVDDEEIKQYETIKIVQGLVTYQINITPLTGKVSLERVF